MVQDFGSTAVAVAEPLAGPFHTPARISRSGTSKQSAKFFFDLLQSLTPLFVHTCVERAVRAAVSAC